MAFPREFATFQNSLFTSNSSQGNYRTQSPLLHNPQKRPNTAPEFFCEKLATFSELKFCDDKIVFDGSELDDEARFRERTVSPITGEFIVVYLLFVYLLFTNVSV